MKYLFAAGLIGGNSILIWACVHFGTRWIERMLCVQPEIDPSKPIVREAQVTRRVGGTL